MDLYSSAWLFVSFIGFGALAGCGDENDIAKMDAATRDGPADTASDAPVADITWDEGGGTTLEFQTIYVAATPTTPNLQARVTSYYWKSLTPGKYNLADIPGCTKTGIGTPTDDSDDRFPWGMGTGAPAAHSYLDVGTPIVTGGANQLTVPRGAVPFKDGESRYHDGVMNFFVNSSAGLTYFDRTDAPYSLILTGSSEWPAQAYPDAFYMPPAFTLTQPPLSGGQLLADTDFVQTWQTPIATPNLPAGASVLYVTGFIVPGKGPLVVCFQDNINAGQLTVPKALVNYVRSEGTAGVMGRALITHRIQELTDGVTHNRKRMDFVTKWCYVSPWTAN